MSNSKTLFLQNEAIANRIAKRIFTISLVVLTVTWILNSLKVLLLIDFWVNIAFAAGVPGLILPIILHKIWGDKDSKLKYAYVIGGVYFIGVINSCMGHMTIIVLLFPILVSGLYFSTRLVKITTVCSIVVLFFSQIISFFGSADPEENFDSFNNYLWFAVVARLVCLFAMSFFVLMMCKRTTNMLGDLMGAEEQRALLEKNKALKEEAMGVSDELLKSVEELDNTTKIVSDANMEIAMKAEDVLLNTVENVNKVKYVNDKIEDIVRIIEDLHIRSKSISYLSENVKTMTDNNSDRIENATLTMNRINMSATNCREIINIMGEQSRQIEGIVELITDISSQVKILSLNAAIEAARAGEYGRGFVVVADEIQNLSNQTQNSVGNIASIIEDVVANTSLAVNAIDESSKLSLIGMKDVKNVESTSNEISQFNKQMIDEITDLYNVAKNIRQHSREIETQMNEMKNAMNNNFENIEQVSAATEESSASTHVIVTMVDTIKRMSDKLNAVVNE